MTPGGLLPDPAPLRPQDGTPLLFRRHAVALGLVVLAFVLAHLDKVWSLSIDLPHHYALAYRIAEQWHLPAGDPSLAEMNDYPWMAHVIAAVLGTAVHSVYTGLQLVALLSLAGLWVAVIGLVCTLPRQQAACTCIALAALVYANRKIFGLDLHGTEIFRNFFLPQLTAHALLFCALWNAVLVERRHGWVIAAAALALWAQLVAFFHLLPALLLTGTAVLSILVGVALQVWRRSASRLTLVACAVLVVITSATMVLHPVFKATARIAANDGDLTLSGISYPDGLRWLCLLVAVVAIAQIWIGARLAPARAAVRYLGLYGLTTVGVCMLQMIALKLGHGSNYGVKKYGFALTTHLLLSVAILLGWAIDRRLRLHRASLPLGHGAATVLVCGTFAAVVLSLLPPLSALHASDIARLERQLVTLRDAALPRTPAGKADIAVELEGFPPQVSYMLSLGILHTPSPMALQDIMGARKLSDPRGYAHVVTSTGPIGPVVGSCRPAVHGPLSVIPAACLREPSAPCKGEFDLTAPGGLGSLVLAGFSGHEPNGRWTDGARASISCVVEDPSAAHEAVLTLAPFVSGELHQQRIRIAVGANAAREFTLDSEASVVVPLGALKPGRLDLALETPDAKSPRDVGHNGDTRVLGFLIRNIQFR